MPYLGKWIEAIVCVAHVMRVDGCDRFGALRQIEAAIADGAVGWLRPLSARGWRRNLDHLEPRDLVSRRHVLKLWPDPRTVHNPTPLLTFIEPRIAVQTVCDAFGYSATEAVAFLDDARLAGNLDLRFVADRPPGNFEPAQIDWHAGAVVISRWLQTSTIPIGGFERKRRGLPPREYRYPGRTETERYGFRIDRRQLDAILGTPEVLTGEANLESLPPAEPEAESISDPTPQHRQRAAYREPLARFMARKDINQMLRAGAKAVAAEFVEAMREQRPTLTLPQLRYIDVQVQKILDRRKRQLQGSGTNQPKPQLPTAPNSK